MVKQANTKQMPSSVLSDKKIVFANIWSSQRNKIAKEFSNRLVAVSIVVVAVWDGSINGRSFDSCHSQRGVSDLFDVVIFRRITHNTSQPTMGFYSLFNLRGVLSSSPSHRNMK
jgi:hypothetical protein